MTDVLSLAGNSAHGIRFLALAEDNPDGDLSLDLRTEIAALASSTVRPNSANLLFCTLRDAVADRDRRQRVPDHLPGVPDEELDRRVLSILFRLLTGSPECPRCLRPALTVQTLRAEGSCDRHTVRRLPARPTLSVVNGGAA